MRLQGVLVVRESIFPLMAFSLSLRSSLLSRALLALPFSLALLQLPSNAASIGEAKDVNFDQAILAESCAIAAANGSLGFDAQKNAISSDPVAGPNGTPAPASVVVVTNLPTVILVADNPLLTRSAGIPVPHTGAVRFGAGAYGVTSSVELASNTSSSLDTKFVTAAGSFAPGTYTAKVTVTCTDNGTK